MNTTGNAVTDHVTNEPRTRDVTLPHTTPHHTTPLSTGLSGPVSVRKPPPGTDLIAAAATTLTSLRPDWRYDTLYAALRDDPRPWRDVIAAGLACALDPQAHPALIATTNPARVVAEHGPTSTPPTIAELRRAQQQREQADCGHGDVAERCALCRHHIPGQEPA